MPLQELKSFSFKISNVVPTISDNWENVINQHEQQGSYYLDKWRENENFHLHYTSQGERSNLGLPQEQEDPLEGIVDVETSKSLLPSVFFSELESFRFDISDVYSASYFNQESVMDHQGQEKIKGGNVETKISCMLLMNASILVTWRLVKNFYSPKHLKILRGLKCKNHLILKLI